jgi:hypothetical protein
MSRATTGLNGDVADACKEQGQKLGLTGMLFFQSQGRKITSSSHWLDPSMGVVP